LEVEGDGSAPRSPPFSTSYLCAKQEAKLDVVECGALRSWHHEALRRAQKAPSTTKCPFHSPAASVSTLRARRVTSVLHGRHPILHLLSPMSHPLHSIPRSDIARQNMPSQTALRVVRCSSPAKTRSNGHAVFRLPRRRASRQFGRQTVVPNQRRRTP